YYGDIFYGDLWKYDRSINQWAWMGGSQVPNDPGNYSILGVPDSAVHPRAEASAASWTDNKNHFYLFGGNSQYEFSNVGNDMWVYDELTNKWTWLLGSKEVNKPGVSGSECAFDESNVPTSRALGIGVQLADNSFCLVGGWTDWGQLTVAASRDVWKFNSDS